MTRSFSILTTLALSLMLVLAPTTAEAKRFGGGKSFGKSYSTPKQSPFASSTNKTQTTSTASKPKSGFGGKGMLAGLLAGGLLGALFFGGAFEGFQMMDFLIIALIAFLGFKLIRQFSASRSPSPAQGPANWQRENTQQQYQSSNQFGSAQAQPHPASSDLPPNFDIDTFLEEAKGHYQQLQTIWDQKDYATLATYVSPELFEALKSEREQHGTNNRTEVVSVQTELLRAERLENNASLSIRFHGWIREGSDDDVTGFNEVWHLQRSWDQPGSWVIVGIQPLED